MSESDVEFSFSEEETETLLKILEEEGAGNVSERRSPSRTSCPSSELSSQLRLD